MYSLPTCQKMIEYPLSKDKFKRLVKFRIIDFWQHLLRYEARQLKSLKYFNPDFYSLAFPCKVYLAAGQTRYEVAKLNVQLKMLSGRYRTSHLSRYWTNNKAGICMTGDFCKSHGIIETVSHILTSCIALEPKRASLKKLCLEKKPDGPLPSLFLHIFNCNTEEQTQFLLEPLSNPYVIRLVQNYGKPLLEQICYLTRTFCFSLHRERKILQGTWYGSGFPAPDIKSNETPDIK